MALITLLPKCPNASRVREYCPIACCTVLYKIISKILSNRMKQVLHTVISDTQSAFIPGRMIFDNVILSHELVKGYTKKNISPRCMVKVDIQKAYDSVEREFIQQMLTEFEFPYRYIRWIMVCLTSVVYTINVNGESTQPFQARKGIRQGDPISPYFFVICMEYLSRCLKGLQKEKLFHYHPRCKRMSITHVCFADDLLLFAKGDKNSMQQLMRMLDEFAAVSGLRANQLKSCIYFGGVKEELRKEILEMTRMTEGSLPFKYLGVPLSSQKLSIMQCQPLIQKILSRITCWSARLLSYAGRIQLIKSVLFGIQIYWSQIFLLPQKIIKVIRAACRTFCGLGGLKHREDH